MKNLYVVWDRLASVVASSILIYAADAAAIRGFGDAIQDERSPYGKHVDDFELHCIGEMVELEDGPVFEPKHRVVLTGSQWQASQAPRQEPQLAVEA